MPGALMRADCRFAVVIEQIGTDPTQQRALYLAQLGDVTDWPRELDEPGAHFVVFLALDARGVPDEAVARLADALIRQGAAYVCTWGPDCERVHDLFDAAIGKRFPGEEEARVMTTWHADDDLDQALWFALFSACPDDPFVETCGSLLAIVVANDACAEHLRRRRAGPAALNTAIVP